MLRLSRVLSPLLLLAGAVVLPGCLSTGGSFADLIQGPGGICALLIVILDILAFLSIFQSSASTVSKLLWGALVFFFPLGGLVIWYFFGPKKP